MNSNSELAAMMAAHQSLLIAMIATHPNPRMLRVHFDQWMARHLKHFEGQPAVLEHLARQQQVLLGAIDECIARQG